MIRRAPIVLAVLALLPLASCGRDGANRDAYVLTVRGAAEVTAPGRSAQLGPGRHKLALGQTVRITKGTAVLGLPGRASLELRAGATRGSADDSTVQVASTPTLVDGDALVVAPKEVRLGAGGATFAVRAGAARLRRSSGVTVAVYTGTVGVVALGRTLPAPVTALRQVAIADTGALPRRAVPLVFDRRQPDPWDVRFLGDAIDLGEQLDRRSLALSGTLRPAAPPDARFLTTVVPALRAASGFGDALLDPARAVGETVVGASIALGGGGGFVSRWNAAFAFRSQGADWGLVAADQRARRQSLFGVLDGVLDSVPSGVVARLTPSGPSRTTSTTSTTPPQSTPPTNPGGPTPPTIPPPTVPPRPDPLGGLLGGLLGDSSGQGQPSLVQGVLGRVDGLLSPGNGPTG
jgi:hypothetical protein